MRRLLIVIYILLPAICLSQESQVIKITSKELRKAFDSKDVNFFQELQKYQEVSIISCNKVVFSLIPSSFIFLNHDLFLAKKKKWRAEYSILKTENGFELLLYDIGTNISYKLIVTKESDDYFVFFNRGKKDYFIPKECSNCSFEISNP